jgi:hypothetical protein
MSGQFIKDHASVLTSSFSLPLKKARGNMQVAGGREGQECHRLEA